MGVTHLNKTHFSLLCIATVPYIWQLYSIARQYGSNTLKSDYKYAFSSLGHPPNHPLSTRHLTMRMTMIMLERRYDYKMAKTKH